MSATPAIMRSVSCRLVCIILPSALLAQDEITKIPVKVEIRDHTTNAPLPGVELQLVDAKGVVVNTLPDRFVSNNDGEVTGVIHYPIHYAVNIWFVEIEQPPMVVFKLNDTAHPGSKVVGFLPPDETYVSIQEKKEGKPVRFKNLDDLGAGRITLVLRISGVKPPCAWQPGQDWKLGECVDGRRQDTRAYVLNRVGCQTSMVQPVDDRRDTTCCIWKKEVTYSACSDGKRMRRTTYTSSNVSCTPVGSRPPDTAIPEPCGCSWVLGAKSETACRNGIRTITIAYVSDDPLCRPPLPQPADSIRTAPCDLRQDPSGPSGTQTYATCVWELAKEQAPTCKDDIWTYLTPHRSSDPTCTPAGPRPPDNVRTEARPCRQPAVEGTQPGTFEMHFTVGSADPEPGDEQRLKDLLDGTDDVAWILITGHADHAGGHAYNHQLAQARANAAARLCFEHGVGPDRVQVLVFGEHEITGLTSRGAANRKVTVEIHGTPRVTTAASH